MSKLHLSAAMAGLAAIVALPVAYAQQRDIEVQPSRTAAPAIDPAGTNTAQPERYEARRVGTDRARQGQGPTVTEALVQKLIKANEAEIELAQMAKQKTQNNEVRQLAQTIIQDHQALNQKLNGLDLRTSQDAPTVPQQLCDIGEQACENALQMTKKMLSNYNEQDFTMAFLGQQIVAHTMMLAELRAIESTGPDQLQPVAEQAASKVEMHLEKAKKLARKFEKDQKQRS